MTMGFKVELSGAVRFAANIACLLAVGAGCHQTLGAGGKCGGPDARASTNVSDSSAGVASNDPGCPAAWSEIVPGGYPATCTSNGLICTYPQGQAECDTAGSVSKWATSGATPGCGETAPVLGTACDSPGLSCQYITGPPDGRLHDPLLLRRNTLRVGASGDQWLPQRQYLRSNLDLRLRPVVHGRR